MKKREEIEKKLGLNLCPIRTVLAQIGDKWSLLVILQLKVFMKQKTLLQRKVVQS